MNISDGLDGVSRLFIDTAPVIYFVERNPHFVNLVDPIFERLEIDITPVISPITLAECLIHPIRLGLIDLEQAFVDVMQQEEVIFVDVNSYVAREAARIRVHYNLQLPDALQVTAALITECQAFLTNDDALKRVRELRVVASSLNNLALLYNSQGNYAKAEPLYVRSLAIWEKVLNSEHPDVATSLNNLAGLYESLGNYAKAEPLYLRSLAIREKVLGSEHPDVATSLNNLAGLYD